MLKQMTLLNYNSRHKRNSDGDTDEDFKHRITCWNGRHVINGTVKGKFSCPEPQQPSTFTECCGKKPDQFCCNPWDTPVVKWGIAIGVMVGVFVLIGLGYTIQVFRACDKCYHECPVCSTSVKKKQEFLWDTRWYSVSHEGNRYGVTFHSKRFAKRFMHALENHYGHWNTANILKIQKDGYDFVVLSIFFHDLFTPWFYTQGPIKNDEEWIKTDFKDICAEVTAELTMHPCSCFQNHTMADDESYQPIAINKRDDNPMKRAEQNGYKLYKPWTKSTFRSAYPSKRADNPTVVVLEDIIEEHGNTKGTQTRREIKI